MRCTALGLCCLCILTLAKAQLKPVEENDQGNQFLLQLISACDKLKNFKNIITYCGNADLDVSGSINSSLQQLLMETLHRPVMVVSNKIGSFNYTHNYRDVVVVLFADLNDEILNVVRKTLKGSIATLLFVYRPKNDLPITDEELNTFFKWCQLNYIHEVIFTFKRNKHFEMWSYGSKPILHKYQFEFEDINLSNAIEYRKLYRYRFSAGVFQSLPNVFMVSILAHIVYTYVIVSICNFLHYFSTMQPTKGICLMEIFDLAVKLEYCWSNLCVICKGFSILLLFQKKSILR